MLPTNMHLSCTKKPSFTETVQTGSCSLLPSVGANIVGPLDNLRMEFSGRSRS